MTRTKIAVGFTLVAGVFATSVATSYGSSYHAFTKAGVEIKGKVPTKQEGAQQKIKVGTAETICEKESGLGVNAHPSEILFYTFNYIGCKTVGKVLEKSEVIEVPAEVKTAGCEGGLFTKGTFSISCGTGAIVVTTKLGEAATCTTKIPTQSGLEKVSYSPLETKTASIKSQLAVSGIKETNSCGLIGNAEYNGVVTVSPEEAGVTLEIK